MDKGEFIKNGYTVEPGEGGSFIVVRGGAAWRNNGMIAEMRGFTHYRDLLQWLSEEHGAAPDISMSEPSREKIAIT